MHTALIADKDWLDDEEAMFRFLVIGLIDEQIRVAQVVPGNDQRTSKFGECITWCDSRHDLVRRLRLRALAPALDGVHVTVLHALDGRLWSGGLSLASHLNVPIGLHITSAVDLERISRMRPRIVQYRAGFSAATTSLAEAVRQYVPESTPVELISPGVHLPAEMDCGSSRQDLCLVITGNGTFDSEYRSLFEALRKFTSQRPDTLMFFECHGHDTHDIWQATRRFGLHDQSSMVPPRTGHEQLLAGAHLLIQPQALGHARSLALQAMAFGIGVLARADPWLDYLIDDVTAWIIKSTEPDSWLEVLCRAADDTDQLRRLGVSARQWIGQNCLAASQVENAVRLYRRLTGEAYRFPDVDRVED